MSEVAQGWRNDSKAPGVWPAWVGPVRDLLTDEVSCLYSHGKDQQTYTVILWKGLRRWVLYNDKGVRMGTTAGQQSTDFPMAFLSDVVPDICIPPQPLYPMPGDPDYGPPNVDPVQPPPHELAEFKNEPQPEESVKTKAGKRRIGANNDGQTTIKNDGSWKVTEPVEVDVPASEEEVHAASQSMSDHTLRAQQLRANKTLMNTRYTKLIARADGAASEAAHVVNSQKKNVMLDADVHFDPKTGTKRAIALKTTEHYQKGDVMWTHPMTPDEMDIGDPGKVDEEPEGENENLPEE